MATLKGPNTLFYIPSIETDLELVKRIPNYDGRDYAIHALARDLDKTDYAIIKNNIVSALLGYGTVHLTGD